MKTETIKKYEGNEKVEQVSTTERSDEVDYKHSRFWGLVLISIITIICVTIVAYKIL